MSWRAKISRRKRQKPVSIFERHHRGNPFSFFSLPLTSKNLCSHVHILYIIKGLLDQPSSGELFVLGTAVTNQTRDRDLAKIRLANIGYVFQTFNLMSAMSAVENVELPMMMLDKLSRKERRKRAIELLENVGLGDRLEHLPSEVSTDASTGYFLHSIDGRTEKKKQKGRK